jgi:DNA-directed RNA polymerase subunit RPC12/RpoP
MKRMSRLSYSTGLRMREIKHGKWVSTGNALGYTEYHCSACDNYLFLVSWKDELYNYCPHCGARMDKEENND